MPTWENVINRIRSLKQVTLLSYSDKTALINTPKIGPNNNYAFHYFSDDKPLSPTSVRNRISKLPNEMKIDNMKIHIKGHIIISEKGVTQTLRNAMSQESSWISVVSGLSTRSPKWFISPWTTKVIISIIDSIILHRLPEPTIIRTTPHTKQSSHKFNKEAITASSAEPKRYRGTSSTEGVKVRDDKDAEALSSTGPQIHPFIPPPVGSKVDDFRLVSFLGSGKTSLVYSARVERELNELGLKRGMDVALKFYNLWVLTQAFQFERIGRELMVTSRIIHPSVVKIYDLRISPLRAHRTYMVMELVEGKSLYTLVAGEGALPFDKTLDYSIQIFEGISHLHSAGVLHRDIKPENIMVADNEQIKIMDFGVVKPTDSEMEMTGTTQFLGTIRYASPEYLMGQGCTAKADIYSAAAVCYFMLYGREVVPKDLHFARQVLSVAREEVNFSPLITANPRVEEFMNILRSCLHKDPSQRPSTATETVDTLRRIQRRK